MAAEASRSIPSPDSYIGSLISLTSKSEIRYEGILYNINTEESSIGLRNVRSFGTEGRKKDGQQLPASDKIYEFILFRGTDIKDLQVKASPPAQTTMQNDPAIIQLNYPHPPTASPILPANLPFGSVSASELSSSTSQLGFQHPSFQGSLPTYQPGGSFGTWSATPPPPMTNVSGLAAPMYWQGYYAHSQGLSHLQQPPLMRPQPGLSMPPMQQTLQFQGTNALLSSGSSNYTEFPLLFPPVNSNLNLASTSFPSTVAPTQVTSLTSEMSPFLGSNKTSLPPPIPSVMLPPVSSLAPSLEASASLPQILPFVASSKPRTGPFSSLANQTETRSTPPIVGSVGSKQLETSVALLTPDQLVQLTPSVHPFSQSLVKVPDEVEVKQPEDRTKALLSERSAPDSKAKTKLTSVPKEPILPLPSPAYQKLVQLTPSMRPFSQSLVKVPDEVEVKPPEDRTKALLSERSAPESKAKTKLTSVPKEPILPLPSPAYQKPNGAILHATRTSREYGRGRGRGRGSGYARPIVKFSEEFDFTAMNEKFNKDKVWGSLGKSKAHSSNGEEEEADQFGEDNAESLKFNVKPFYVKDDFFDTLSCNTNGQTSNGRIKFSEQLKIDNETFGNFQWNNSAYGGHGLGGGRGGRGGGGGGGRGRSSYPGRSYGYFARGRGYNGNNRAS